MPPSEQPRVFISYARKDGAALAQCLHFSDALKLVDAGGHVHVLRLEKPKAKG